jgi:aryl-alcohol dehydrogenase-like predicted oxidoreductase
MEVEMETRQLGKSDLLITPIGIGVWAMGRSWLDLELGAAE